MVDKELSTLQNAATAATSAGTNFVTSVAADVQNRQDKMKAAVASAGIGQGKLIKSLASKAGSK